MSRHLRRSAVSLLIAAFTCSVVLDGVAAYGQGVGAPGVGMPGVGMAGPAVNLPQRQGPAGGAGMPGQMNARVGGGRGVRPGQMSGMAAPSISPSRGAMFMGPRNAAGFSGMSRNGVGVRSSQGFIQNSRNAGTFVPGYGGLNRGNR